MKKLIALKLKTLRNELNYSTEYVSKELKQMGFAISPNTLYNYENGISQPKADMFLSLCKIYKVNSFDIFFNENLSEVQSMLFNGLNAIGEQKAREYIEDLKANPKYTQETKSAQNTTFDFDNATTVQMYSTKVTTNKN